MKNSPFKTLRIRPLTGPVNPVATADELPVGVFAWKEEMEVSSANRLGRRGGFARLSADPAQPLVPTLLKELSSTDGERRLMSCDISGNVKVLSGGSTNWISIGSGLTTNAEWSADFLYNVVVVSDGFGRVKSANLATGGPLTDVADLSGGVYDISAAKVVVQFSGCIMIMNFEEDGQTFGSRIKWSQLNEPTTWATGEGLVAGFQDLPYNQSVLAASVVGDRLLIYTDSAIWAARAVAGAGSAFQFSQLYSDPVGRTKCLAHPRTLVTFGSSHVYLGDDGVYTFSPYQREPQRLEWLDASARILFDPSSDYRISKEYCDVVAGVNQSSTKQEIWISWTPKTTTDETAPRTLIADARFKTCDFSRRGWSSFATHSRTSGTTLDQWFKSYGLDSNDSTNWSCPSSLIGKSMIDECSQCDSTTLFFGALETDGEVKYIGFDGDGDRINDQSYIKEGAPVGFRYHSILRGVVPAGNEDHDKVLRKLTVDVITGADQYNDAARIKLRTAVSQQAELPNSDGDHRYYYLPWVEHDLKPLGPVQSPSYDTVINAGQMRTTPVEWNLFERGRFIYWELSVVGVTDGPFSLDDEVGFTRLDMEVRVVAKK